MAKAQSWLEGSYDEATKNQVKYLMDNDIKELTESFYKDMEFGTGGLRGIMGVGTNRMNIYTVGTATQGLANYLKKNFAGEQVRVAVAHDSRNNSRLFAERTADIFASNGFKVYLFDDSFSALDYKTDVTLRRALKAQTDNATVIIVAQRISTVLHANQILVLDEGRLVGKGTHAQLMVNCPEYQEIARSQLSQKELALDTLNTEKEGE